MSISSSDERREGASSGSVKNAILDEFFLAMREDDELAEFEPALRKVIMLDRVYAEPAIRAALSLDET